jgi:hypothetical protein
MSDKTITLLSALFLALIIGVMSWNDMHPQSKSAAKETDIIAGYYAGEEATAGIIPNDDQPLTIAQGQFDYSRGKTVFVHRGMPPVTIAQRQVNLLLGFSDLPKNPAATLEEIKALLQSWENQGTEVDVIFLDYRPKKPDFKAYSGFFRAFNKYFQAAPHVVIPVADSTWLDDGRKAGRQMLQDEAPQFLFRMDTPELLRNLTSFKYGFQIILPAGSPPGSPEARALEENDHFAGGLLTLSPHMPIPKKEPAIGIFPKF